MASVLFYYLPLLIFLIPLASSTTNYSLDFGRIIEERPISVLTPAGPSEIASLLKSISSSPDKSNLTVAARGNGHSCFGQSEAEGGIVIDMRRLPSKISIGEGYVDVGGGVLWVDLLRETLKHGLSPRSWTDYLYLTVGGTLSNAGMSGQAFKYGPEISNVLELDVITGKGEQMTCSQHKNSDLFYGVLGGLGQFGIITRARIKIQPAPKRVKWVNIPFDDFNKFTEHQEFLISKGEVDYLEGNIDFQGSNPFYVIELGIYYDKEATAEKILKKVTSQLGVGRSTVNVTDISYFGFLNRVKKSEDALRKIGMWDVPHPWLNLFVPKANIGRVKDLIIDTVPANFDGVILIYPFHRNKWNAKMSAMLPEVDPEENIVYALSVLRSELPSCVPGSLCLSTALAQTEKIIDISTTVRGAKQYLPYSKNESQWKVHFGNKWARFSELKEMFDPLHVLAPGQRIFTRKPSGRR